MVSSRRLPVECVTGPVEAAAAAGPLADRAPPMRLSPAILHQTVLQPDPACFPMCHAAYLAELAHGRIFVVWFAGSREWAKDVHLLSATLDRGTGEWGAIRDLVVDPGYSLGNALLLRAPDTEMHHLWYVRTKGYWQEGTIVHMRWPNLDADRASRELVPLAPGWLPRGRPILRGGTAHLPLYHETERVSAVWKVNLATGQGALSATVTAPGGLIHPVLVDVGMGEYRGFYRNQGAPHRMHFAYSMDQGSTWSRPHPTNLRNPNSGIDVVRLPDGRLLCAYNDSERRRYPLSLAVSENGGREWQKLMDLERLPAEFSYPSLLVTGGRVYLAYTHKRTAIKVVTLDPERL